MFDKIEFQNRLFKKIPNLMLSVQIVVRQIETIIRNSIIQSQERDDKVKLVRIYNQVVIELQWALYNKN